MDDTPLILLPSPLSLELAHKAVKSQDARRDEDIEEWAARLAADVANATD